MKSCALATRAAASTWAYTSESHISAGHNRESLGNNSWAQHRSTPPPALVPRPQHEALRHYQVYQVYQWLTITVLTTASHLSRGCVRLAVHDVVHHAATEQQRLLAHKTDLQVSTKQQGSTLSHLPASTGILEQSSKAMALKQVKEPRN